MLRAGPQPAAGVAAPSSAAALVPNRVTGFRPSTAMPGARWALLSTGEGCSTSSTYVVSSPASGAQRRTTWRCHAAAGPPLQPAPASRPSPGAPRLQFSPARDHNGRTNRTTLLPPPHSTPPSNPGPSPPTAPISSPASPASPFADPNTLVGMLMAYAAELQQQQQQQEANRPRGASVCLDNVSFHPPGSERPLLSGVSMTLPANQLGLVVGRSGSGKTTLLQVLAGLTEQTEGAIRITRGGAAGGIAAAAAGGGGGGGGNGNGVYAAGAAPAAGASGGAGAAAPVPAGLSVEERMQQVGLVFQFPERHFLGEDLMQELTFTWPRLPQYWGERQLLSSRMQQALEAVGLEDIPMHVRPWALSGGQQRRLALALQLVRGPGLLLLDEPLAGLDWGARQEVVAILRRLKEQCTLLVVSHDLGEIAPLVDCAWRMQIGGTCEPVAWPPADLAGLE